MADYKLSYDTEAGGPFVEGNTITLSGAGAGTCELVILIDNGASGEMYVSEITSCTFGDGAVLTSGGTTAAQDGAAFLSRFPLKIRDDLAYTASTGNIRLSGTAPALGTTHSCKYDGQTTNFVLNEIITFGNGSTAELISQQDDVATGEIFFRMIDVALPGDGDTISGVGGGDGNIDGAVHTRCYTPNNIHYWFSDKGDDEIFVGDDEQDRTKPRISRRIGVTDVELLGDANIDAALSYRVYGGSIYDAAGDEYNAATIAVVDADGLTEPVIIQDNALLSATTGEYWKNGYMPNAASKINMVIKVASAGVPIDRRVVRFRALENLRAFFTAPDPTLTGGITPVSLVATDDGNNTTPAATVATWTDAAFTYGYATVDHNNDNGAQPYWAVGDLGTRTKAQFHERQKWVQRRGTAETILGLNAQLIVGNDLTFDFEGEAGIDFASADILTFSGNSEGTALVLAVNYATGTTGTLYCQRLTGDVPLDNAVITSSGTGTAVIVGTPISRLIINNLFGTFTGSAFNPANIGMTLEAADATTEDLFTDLLGAQQQPPNNQSGAVNTAIGNVITAYPWDGSSTDAVGDQAPEFTRLTLATALTGVTTSVVAAEAIPTWVPTTGFLRITTNGGIRQFVAYSAYVSATKTFTITSTDFTGDNASIGNGVMPVGLDKVGLTTNEAFTGVYTSNQNKAGTGDQQFVIKVLSGSGVTPKQPSIGTATFTSGGFSVNVTLQDD